MGRIVNLKSVSIEVKVLDDEVIVVGSSGKGAALWILQRLHIGWLEVLEKKWSAKASSLPKVEMFGFQNRTYSTWAALWVAVKQQLQSLSPRVDPNVCIPDYVVLFGSENMVLKDYREVNLIPKEVFRTKNFEEMAVEIRRLPSGATFDVNKSNKLHTSEEAITAVEKETHRRNC